jgi:hypothetical protein
MMYDGYYLLIILYNGSFIISDVKPSVFIATELVN